MIARPAFLSVSSAAALRTSFRFNLCSIYKWAKTWLFSSPLERAITVSCAGPPRGKPEVLLHGRLPSFEGAGVKVARKVVEGEKINDDVRWRREEERDPLASELVELYEELQLAVASTNEVSILQREGARVEHLGHGVYVQYGVQALDIDALEGKTATITREESRSCVRHALDALQNRFRVAVTGQPGIGKTRGSMMYAIQMLLHQKAAVLYVGYKSREMLLFLPTEDGTYRVWGTKSSNFDQTRFQGDARVVAVIDPPEEGPYSSMGRCRILKFVSNNAEKHFRNWEKDGVLLVTSMPTEKEVLVMTKVLWDEDKTPHAWQFETLSTIEKKMSEIEKRIELVGPIPRLVFDSELFRKAIVECITGGAQAVQTVSDSDLYKAMRGKYSPFLAKHPASASSTVFFLNPDTVKHGTWKERRGHLSSLQLTPIAELVLRDRLEKSIAALRTDNFEDFAFDWLCETEGREPEILYGGGSSHETVFRRIVSLGRNEMRVVRPGSKNFPFVDFMLSRTKWFNVKSVPPEAKIVYINEKGALLFLNKMERYMLDAYSLDSIHKILNNDPPVLAIVTNGNVESRLRKEVELSLFGVPVRIEVMNLADVSSAQLLNHVDGTNERLEEYEECMRMKLR